VPVAHSCNPSYSGGRDQEDRGSKPVQANSSQDPISKTPSQNRSGGVPQGEDPEFKAQYHRHTKSVPHFLHNNIVKIANDNYDIEAYYGYKKTFNSKKSCHKQR
jgi:hypothetical protein